MENSAGFHLRRERVVSVGRTVPEGRAAMCTCALRRFWSPRAGHVRMTAHTPDAIKCVGARETHDGAPVGRLYHREIGASLVLTSRRGPDGGGTGIRMRGAMQW